MQLYDEAMYLQQKRVTENPVVEVEEGEHT